MWHHRGIEAQLARVTNWKVGNRRQLVLPGNSQSSLAYTSKHVANCLCALVLCILMIFIFKHLRHPISNNDFNENGLQSEQNFMQEQRILQRGSAVARQQESSTGANKSIQADEYEMSRKKDFRNYFEKVLRQGVAEISGARRMEWREGLLNTTLVRVIFREISEIQAHCNAVINRFVRTAKTSAPFVNDILTSRKAATPRNTAQTAAKVSEVSRSAAKRGSTNSDKPGPAQPDETSIQTTGRLFAVQQGQTESPLKMPNQTRNTLIPQNRNGTPVTSRPRRESDAFTTEKITTTDNVPQIRSKDNPALSARNHSDRTAPECIRKVSHRHSKHIDAGKGARVEHSVSDEARSIACEEPVGSPELASSEFLNPIASSIPSNAVTTERTSTSQMSPSPRNREHTLPNRTKPSSQMTNNYGETVQLNKVENTHVKNSSRDSVANNPSIELWIHTAMRQLRESYAPFCRLYNVCQTRSGTLILPESLRSYEDVLSTCGLDRGLVEFMNIEQPSQTRYKPVSKINGIALSELDMVEKDAPRRGAHHFLADSMKILFFIDSVYGSGQTMPSTLRRSCLTADEVKSEPCSSGAAANTHPAIFVRSESFKDDTWVPTFLQLMTNPTTVNNGHPLVLLQNRHLDQMQKSSTKQLAFCFHSITTSANRYGEIPQSSFRDTNPFFSGNGILRARRVLRDHRDHRDNREGRCRILVMLSSGLPENILSGIHNVSRAIRGRSTHDQQTLSIRFMRHSQQDMSFARRMRCLQKADILIAPHGSHLSDMIFLRTSSAVIELQPFGLNSRMFRGLARQLSLTYGQIVAAPDLDSFRVCMKNSNTHDKNVSLHLLMAKVQAASDEFRNRGRTNLRLGTDIPEFQDLNNVKRCARQQTLKVSPESLTSAIWSQATKICAGRHVADAAFNRVRVRRPRNMSSASFMI